MKSQNSMDCKTSKHDLYGMKIENLLKCSQIKYKLSSLCIIILLFIHIYIFINDTKDYVHSYKEKHKIVNNNLIQLHSRYEFENAFTTQFIYTIYIALNNILSTIFYFSVFKSLIFFDEKSWKMAVNTVSILLPLTIFTGFINM